MQEMTTNDRMNEAPLPRSVFDEDFGFRSRLEAMFETVKREWFALDKSTVRLWPQPGAYTGQWSVVGIVIAGRRIEGVAAQLPETMRFFEGFPGLYTLGFSCLGPRSSLPMHSGEGEDLLRCHLPILIPEPSGIEIRGKTYRWTPGKTFCFDDTAPHRAWNDTDEPKVMLLFDFLRPKELMPANFDAEAAAAQRARDAAHYHRLFPDWRASF